jgi:tetratricopeptide (TPR) repeat protein
LLVEAKKSAEALQPFSAAIAVIGLEPPDAADGMKKVLESQKGEPSTWAGYAKALSTFCAAAKPGDHQSRVYLELGRVLAEKQKDAKAAVKALKQGLSLNSESSDLRKALVAQLRSTGQDKQALPELLALQKVEPLRGETWADLVEVYDSLGKNAESHMAMGPLVLLGHATDLQNSTWKSRTPQPAMLGAGAFNGAALSQTLVQGVSLDAIGLLEQMASFLPKVFPPTLSHYGTSAREKVPPKGNHPCRAVLDRLSHCYGGLEIDLYPSDSEERIRVVYTDPIGLVVPASVADLPEVDQAVYMGPFVANIARGVHAVDALDEEELALALGAATRIVAPEAEVPGVSSRRLGSVTKKLSKALPWLSKGRFEDAAKRYAAAPVVRLSKFRRQVQTSAFRAAIIVADDVTPLARLEQGAWQLAAVERSEVEKLIADLLSFWASSTSMDLRKQIGLL